MAQNVYECMFVLDSNRYARDQGGVARQIPEMVERFGGEVLASRLWNEQKLAYPINGHRKGTYWLTYFRLESEQVGDFNRACKLNENILRSLTLKVDPRLVEAVVAHAGGDGPAKAAADAPPSDSKSSDSKSSDSKASDSKASDSKSSDSKSSDSKASDTKASDTKSSGGGDRDDQASGGD